MGRYTRILSPKPERSENASYPGNLNKIATGKVLTDSSFFDVRFSACAWGDCFANKTSEYDYRENVG